MQGARLTFLGTGTSQGIPIIGCGCNVCSSSDSRDKRYRSSALVEWGGMKILIDAGPDFRSQMLSAGIGHLDAILLTHNHKDHTGGLDDLRSLNYIDRQASEIYCEQKVIETLQREYAYVFAKEKYPGAPEWHVHRISDKPFAIRRDLGRQDLVWVHDVGYGYRQPDGSILPTNNEIVDVPCVCAEDLSRGILEDGVVIVPIRGYHDKMPVLGFRFGNIAYITDMSTLPDFELEKLQGLDHVTLNTVGYKHHHSHFSLDEALSLADRIGAKHTWLTHLSHTFPRYEVFCSDLEKMCKDRGIRSIVQPAYDGLVLQ